MYLVIFCHSNFDESPFIQKKNVKSTFFSYIVRIFRLIYYRLSAIFMLNLRKGAVLMVEDHAWTTVWFFKKSFVSRIAINFCSYCIYILQYALKTAKNIFLYRTILNENTYTQYVHTRRKNLQTINFKI